MTTRLLPTVGCAIVLAAAASTPALADWPFWYVRMNCDAPNNRAIIRFSVAYNEEDPFFSPLPREIDGGLSLAEPQRATSCTFADGRDVRFRHGMGQAFPYGHTGVPPDWLSLWLGGRKVLSRLMFSGPECNDCMPHSLIIDAAGIRLCHFGSASAPGREFDLRARGPATCAALGSPPLIDEPDAIEYPPPGTPPRVVGAINVTNAKMPELCAALIAPDWRRHDPAVFLEWTEAVRGPHGVEYGRLPRQDAITLRNVGGEVAGFQEFGLVGAWSFGGVPVRYGRFDLDNDGANDLVLEVSDRRNPFDGDILIAAPSDRTPDTALRTTRWLGFPEGLRKLGWHVFAGGQTPYRRDEYTHFSVFRADGSTFLLAHPADWNREPTAILYRPSPDGQIEEICRFERVRQNF